jgi:hypothetical protein
MRFIPHTGPARSVPQVLRADAATVMNHRHNAKHKSLFFFPSSSSSFPAPFSWV